MMLRNRKMQGNTLVQLLTINILLVDARTVRPYNIRVYDPMPMRWPALRKKSRM